MQQILRLDFRTDLLKNFNLQNSDWQLVYNLVLFNT